MNIQIPAGWQWRSKQGSACVENRDACGVFETDTYTFFVVVDTSPRGERGTQFNACWISQVLDYMGPELPSKAFVLSALLAAQKHLRTEHFFTERASYIAILLPRDTQDIYVFSCGDCSLGVQTSDGSIEWLTRPHTLNRALEELGVDTETSKRHIVTRTLNARRFEAPEVCVIPSNPSGLWVLATDGYRYPEADDTGHPTDDCSALLIGSGLENNPTSAYANLFVRASSTPKNEEDLTHQIVS